MFKNEMGKEVKISYSVSKMRGMKGAKNKPVTYDGIHVKLSSVDHNADFQLTKKELDKLRFGANKFMKEVGKKSELDE